VKRNLVEAAKYFHGCHDYNPQQTECAHNLVLVYLQQQKWTEAFGMMQVILLPSAGSDDVANIRICCDYIDNSSHREFRTTDAELHFPFEVLFACVGCSDASSASAVRPEHGGYQSTRQVHPNAGEDDPFKHVQIISHYHGCHPLCSSARHGCQT